MILKSLSLPAERDIHTVSSEFSCRADNTRPRQAKNSFLAVSVGKFENLTATVAPVDDCDSSDVEKAGQVHSPPRSWGGHDVLCVCAPVCSKQIGVQSSVDSSANQETIGIFGTSVRASADVVQLPRSLA